MKTLLLVFVLVVSVGLLQFCSPGKKAQANVVPAKTTYEANVHPIIMSSCAPCHVAGQGRATVLNNYTAAKTEAEEIIARIGRNPGDKGFMPMKHPKLPDSTITVFARWKADGLLEK